MSEWLDSLTELPGGMNIVKMTKLKAVRKNYGMTRNQLSMLTGIPVKTLEALEQGRRKITGLKIDRFFLLCEALNCKPEDIIE